MKRIETGRTVLALDFSPDGRFLASGGWKHVTLWDLATGNSVDLSQEPCSYVYALVFCGDGTHLAWLCQGNGIELRIGNVNSARQTKAAALGLGGGEAFYNSISCCDLAVTPEGDVCKLHNDVFSQWSVPDLRNHSPKKQKKSSTSRIWQSPAGRIPVVESGRKKKPLPLYTVEPGTLLGRTSGDGMIVWKVGDEKPYLEHKEARIRAVAFSPDGRFIYGTGAKHISVWDTHSRTRSERFDWDISTPECIAVSPDGLTAAASGFTGEIVVWDLEG